MSIVKTDCYYKSKAGKVRDAEIKDVFELAPNMRKADKKEIWRSHHHTPEQALLYGYTNSVLCYTVERNESPIAMFGVVPESLLSDKAYLWLLGSPELKKVKKSFMKQSRYFVNLMLEHYPLLFNFVDIENWASIRWLTWLKCEWGIIKHYGVEQQSFQYFQFRR